MRSYVAVSIFAFSASVFSAPTPQLGLGNVVGSVTGTTSGTIGSLTSTVGKTVDPVTGLVTDDADLKGVTGLVKEKRQLKVVDGLTRPVTDLTKPVTDIVGDATKVRVVGNARRQLHLPLVGGATSTVDRVTDSVNLSGAVEGVKTDVHDKRQLHLPAVGGVTSTLDRVTDSVNLGGAVEGVNTDVHSKRQLHLPAVGGATSTVDRVTDSVNLSGAVDGVKTDIHDKRELLNLDTTTQSVDGLTGLNSNELTADATHNQVVDAGKLLDLKLDVKRGVPVVQDLPVGGGVSGILDNTPVVGGVTNTVESVTGDLNPVTELIYDAAKPVTGATEVLDVRAPILDEVEVNNLVGDVNVPAVVPAVKDVPVVSDI